MGLGTVTGWELTGTVIYWMGLGTVTRWDGMRHHGIISIFDYHMKTHVDGLGQERRNSIANALELRISCTNPSMSFHVDGQEVWSIIIHHTSWPSAWDELLSKIPYIFRILVHSRQLTNTLSLWCDVKHGGLCRCFLYLFEVSLLSEEALKRQCQVLLIF